MEIARRQDLRTIDGPAEYFAIQESLDGSPVSWMEKVADEDYLAGPSAPKSA